MQLEAMTVAVTGAQQGMGAAIAGAAAREGANVVVNWLDDELRARAVHRQASEKRRRTARIRQ